MNTEKFLEEIRKFLEDGTKPSDECIFFMKEHLDITNYGKLKKTKENKDDQ